MKSIIVGGLDIETTGLKQSEGHRIIEFATSLHRYFPDTGEVRAVGQYEQRINPGRSIDPAAQAVHDISFEMVEGCPKWEEVAPKVVKVMSACDVIVAHNGDEFDLPFVGNELLRVGQPVPSVLTVDTMVSGTWATPLGKLPSLRELCFACGVDYDEEKAHAALYDVGVMMQCFFHALNKGFYQLPKEMYLGIAA